MTAPARADAVVVGAGWAGLAAAIRLAQGGQRVRLIDAAPQAGGRARRVRLAWKHPLQAQEPIELDNGQHLLLGAYREVLALLQLIGTLDDEHVERRPMRLAGSSGLLMERHPLTGLLAPLAPLTPLLALLGARGLSAGSRWALVRTLAQLRIGRWRLPRGVSTVGEWYRRTHQPQELIERFWQPLAISALNTPADSACAATFLAVLRDSLGAGPEAGDFILPRQDLSHLFVDPAIAWLRRHDAAVVLRTDIRRIERAGPVRYRVVASARGSADPLVVECDHLVLATPPYVAARLLEGLVDAGLIAQLKRFEYLPITTAYLGWPAGARPVKASAATAEVTKVPKAESPSGETAGPGAAELALPALLALSESAAQERFAQWFFDRGRHQGWRVAALVLSDSRAARELGDDRLSHALVRQVVEELALPEPAAISLIHEKRATFACTPDRPRLTADAAGARCPGLALAGDYTYPNYPATLEGAVRSGRLAAEAVLAH
jgi:hydroxysqualene dehydroxylase